MPAADPARPVAVVEGAPAPDVMSGAAGVVPLSADPLAAGPLGGTAPAEALDGGTPPQGTDEATAAAGIAAAPDGAGSGGDDGGGGGGGRQSRDATSPSTDQVAALPPVAAVDTKEVVRPAKSLKGSRVRSAKAKTARSSRAVKEGVGVPKASRSARSHDAAAAKPELTPRTPSRNKPQVAEVPSGNSGCVAGTAALQAATVAVGERSPLSPEELGAAAAAGGPAVEAAEAEPVLPGPAVPAGVASAKTAAAVVSAAAAGTAGNTSGAGLLPHNGAAAASVVTQSLPAAMPHVADADSPLPEEVPPPAEEYRRQRSRSEPAVPGSRKARVSGVSSHLSSASSASRHMGGAGSSSTGGGGAHGGSSGTFSDSMLSNGSANGSLRLALALSRASSSTSSLASPATTENLAAAARVADGSLAVHLCGANTRRPPSTARARNYGASPSLSMGSGRRVAPHAPSSLRDLRKVSGVFGGRLLALRRERSVGLHDDRGGGGDGSGGDELSGKAAGIAARLGSFDHGGLLGSRKAARDVAAVESSPSLSGAADSSGGTPPLRRIYASNGGNRFLASSFSGGTSSSRRLGALLRAASGAAGSATAGMAGRSSSRVRPSRSGHLGTDAVPPGGGGGGSGSGSGGSGGDAPNLDDLTDASARTRRVAPASSTSSNLSLSPAAKAAAISSPTFASSDRPGRRAEGPSQGDRHDGTSKIAALMHADRGRAAKPAERMFATELTSVSQLVASNVQFRETDMASGGRRVSARLRRRPVSVPAVGGATAMPPLPHKAAGGAGKDADARRRFGQPPRLELPPSDKVVEESASAGELRLSSPVSPPPS